MSPRRYVPAALLAATLLGGAWLHGGRETWPQAADNRPSAADDARQGQSEANADPVSDEEHADHAIGEAHVGHDHGEEHADHDESQHALRLTPEQMARHGLSLAVAGPGTLHASLRLPGQIVLNADAQARVVPRVAGTLVELRKNLGDTVAAGEVLAVIESRELADLSAEWLAAEGRLALAQTTFERERDLWRKKIAAEQDYLQAQQQLGEARIEQRQLRQKLHALGLDDADLESLRSGPDEALTRLEITSPLAGTIIEKRATLGEVADTTTPLYTIADLSTVWVELSVFPKELPRVNVGQPVEVTAVGTAARGSGVISYLQPVASAETRAVMARVVLDNPDGHWRPGLSVTADVLTGTSDVPVLIAARAVQRLDDQPVVFVEADSALYPRPVQLGRSDGERVEVLQGLQAGERYVATNSFVLKSELSKSETEHVH